MNPKTRAIVWARAAGRCQYPGCNESLIGNLISGNEDGNFGLIAHIVAETPGGPRGDAVRSPQLADDPSNLMLLCYPHHKLIDQEDLVGHGEQVLINMKAAHEERIRTVTDILPDRASHVLRYGARIGAHESPVSFDRVRVAMIPHRYPADGQSIGIEILGNAVTDDEDDFWKSEPSNLRRQFERLVQPRIASRNITHLSVFALAPIPLLIELGRLLGDIVPADIYQLHREPCGWQWARNHPQVNYDVSSPQGAGRRVALKLCLSAAIGDDRVKSALGNDISIWTVAAKNPHNDVMRYPEDLQQLRKIMRGVFSDIKLKHGPNATIHVFPAVPVSAAVEIGRVWMPKADLPLTIYDEARGLGFVRRLQIG